MTVVGRRRTAPPDLRSLLLDLQLPDDGLLAVLVRVDVVERGPQVAVGVEVDGPADALVVDVLPRLERLDRRGEVQVRVRLSRGRGDPLDLLDDVGALARVRRDGGEDADHRAVEVVRVEGLALLRARLRREELVERVRGLRARRRAGDRTARALERGRRDEVGDR